MRAWRGERFIQRRSPSWPSGCSFPFRFARQAPGEEATMRSCLACNSPHRADIDRRLARGESGQKVAAWLLQTHGKKYAITHASLRRHTAHLTPEVKRKGLEEQGERAAAKQAVQKLPPASKALRHVDRAIRTAARVVDTIGKQVVAGKKGLTHQDAKVFVGSLAGLSSMARARVALVTNKLGPDDEAAIKKGGLIGAVSGLFDEEAPAIPGDHAPTEDALQALDGSEAVPADIIGSPAPLGEEEPAPQSSPLPGATPAPSPPATQSAAGAAPPSPEVVSLQDAAKPPAPAQDAEAPPAVDLQELLRITPERTGTW